MALTPVQQAKTYELVIARLKDAILDGSFAPGSRLPSVKALSESLGVGQAAVREAVSALRVMNLLEVRQGDGTFVASLDADRLAHSVEQLEASSKQDIRALLELRISIETGASRLAADRRRESHLREMRTVLDTMAADLGDAQTGEEADWAFHYAIAKASHNPYMQSLMDTISTRLKSALLTSRLALYQIAGEDRVLFEQHWNIFNAIEHGDAEAASNAMFSHLAHVSEQLFGGLGQ